MLVQDQPIHAEFPFLRSAPSRVGTVLVTGSAGLLGSALCAMLADRGHRVIRHRRLRTEAGHLAFPLEQLALIEPAVRQCRPDWVIHAAANTSVDAGIRAPAAC
jgi:nucleoside-diphosphate-sugar epimerase